MMVKTKERKKKMRVLWLMTILLWLPTRIRCSNVKPGCPETCGNISVPYPFGIDDPNCATNNRHFVLKCDHSFTPPKLIFGTNVGILNISFEEGTMIANLDAAVRCYNKTGGATVLFDQPMNMGGGPFRFSNTRNKLTGFGCDTIVLMEDKAGSFGSGCISLCSENLNMSNRANDRDSSCSGIGCCQTQIPLGLKTLNISLASPKRHVDVWNFNPCEYGFLADERTFNVSDLQLSRRHERGNPLKSNVVIEWVIKEEFCPESMSSTVCGSNTQCIYSQNGNGYRCLCKQGFNGNPYLADGCQDIDECKEPEIYPCEGSCKNTIGDYKCSCPIGMRGDGKVRCQGFRVTTIVAVVGSIVFSLIIGLLIFIACQQRKKERNFQKNGGMLLKHQRVRIFKEAELLKATKNYDHSQFLGEGGFGSVYKGVLPDDITVAVKKPKEMDKTRINQEFQHEIGIVSQVNHKNVVKVLGLCLETKVPLLVYEYISNGTLFQHIHDKRSGILRNWKNRLRIAAETASALDYLHSLADPPIIHADVKSSNILLDDTYTAKVSDFGASVLISPGESAMVTKIQGTFGYLDPEYLMTGDLTEKSDVYSFGVVLVELLTGEKPGSGLKSGGKTNIIQYFISSVENNTLRQVLSFVVADEVEMEEIEIVAELAKRCVSSSGLKRPSMKEVAEELARLKKLHDNSWGQENSQETEHLLGDSSDSYSVLVVQPDSHFITSFGIENYSNSM